MSVPTQKPLLLSFFYVALLCFVSCRSGGLGIKQSNKGRVPEDQALVVGCLSAQNPPRLMRASQELVTVGQPVVWQVVLPNDCTGTYILERQGANPIAFTSSAFFMRTYDNFGTQRESIAVSKESGRGSIGAEALIEVLRPDDINLPTLNCQTSISADVLTVPTDANLVPLQNVQLNFSLSINRAASVVPPSSILPNHSSFLVTTALPTAAASAHSITADLRASGQFLFTFSVREGSAPPIPCSKLVTINAQPPAANPGNPVAPPVVPPVVPPAQPVCTSTDYPNRGVTALSYPLRPLPAGTDPNPEDEDVTAAPLFAGNLKQGDVLKIKNIWGELIFRVRHSGNVEGWTACPNGAVVQFVEGVGKVVAAPVALSQFATAAGVTVPANAVAAVVSFPDSAYWDNEFSQSDAPRVPARNTDGSTHRTTNGCHFTVVHNVCN